MVNRMSVMASDDFIDSTIADLKILGMLPKHGKLCLRRGNLGIDHPRAQGLRRWINGDSRDHTLVHAKVTINNSIKIARSMMSGPSSTMTDWTLQRIYDEMEHSEMGLKNLKTTYVNDSMMIANLDVLIERQTAHREEIGTHLALRGKRDKEADSDSLAVADDGD
jgi:hypothetical protein